MEGAIPFLRSWLMLWMVSWRVRILVVRCWFILDSAGVAEFGGVEVE
jgi:hypothetical protein